MTLAPAADGVAAPGVTAGRGSPYARRMSWDEAFAYGYENWSAHMTADIAFYVGLARQAQGPLVELAVGNGRVAIPVAQAAGRSSASTPRPRCSGRRAPGPRRPVWSSTYARATCATWRSTSPPG